MQNLPVGVYCVHPALGETVTFRHRTYTVTPGTNAFSSFEELAKQPLLPVAEPFLGRSDTPVILVPDGVIPIGEIGKVAERFRVVFPCAVAILGDDNTVIQGSYYFGSLNVDGNTNGTFYLENLTLGCRVADTRTGGNDVSLHVKNCRLTAAISGHLVTVGSDFAGQRTALLEGCTLDGTPSMNGEGSIFFVGSGDGRMQNCTVRNTPKFFGMSNYLQTAATPFHSFTAENCRFENCTSLRCFTFLGGGTVTFRNCVFSRVPAPVIQAKNTPVTLENCQFDGDQQVISDGTVNQKHSAIATAAPAPRRTQPDPAISYPLTDPHRIGASPDFTTLDRLYAGRQCYHGDFHCHSNSGGTSDGKTPLSDYVRDMQKVGSDFAAIVDHRQMRHFFLPEWDETYLICGTEPGQYLDDPTRPAIAKKMDYTMIFPDKQGLAKVMEAFPEFHFTGTPEEGHYNYHNFTPKRFRELAEYVYSIGGLMSHAHPKQLMVSDDPLHYYFGDHMAIETIHSAPNSMATRMNRQLWMDLLAKGCRVLTHGSSDSHGPVAASGMTTVYAKRHHSTDIFNLVRSGDCTAGAIGIRMCIDDAPMGSVTPYVPGKTLYIKVDDTHPGHVQEDTVYTFRLYTDRGLAYAQEFAGEALALAFPVEDRKFYRVEIYNESDGHTVALSNPIFLQRAG